MEGREGVGESVCARVLEGHSRKDQWLRSRQRLLPGAGAEELGRPAELPSCGGVAPCPPGLRRDSLSPGPGN